MIQVFCLTFQMEVLEDQQLQMLFIGTRAKHLLFGIIQCHQMDLVFKALLMKLVMLDLHKEVRIFREHCSEI